MEWRAILAVVLSIFVLILWQYVFVPLPEPPPPPTTPESQERPAPESRVQTPSVTRPTPPSAPGAGDLTVAQATPPGSLNERLHVANFSPSVAQLTVTAEQPRGAVRFEYQDPTGWRAVKTFELQYGSYAMAVDVTLNKPGLAAAPAAAAPVEPERLVTLENDVLRVVMTTRGAHIRELFLKKFAAPWRRQPNLAVSAWKELFVGQSPRPLPPCAMSSSVVNLVAPSENALPPSLEVAADGRQALLRWGDLCTSQDANGTYTAPLTFISGERRLDTPAAQTADQPPCQSWLDTSRSGQASCYPPKEFAGTVQWAALQNKYYAIAIIPRSESVTTVWHQGSTPERYAIGLGWPLTEPETVARFTIYTGPKELERLAALNGNGKSLAELVYYNYGWVRILRPDVWLLRPLQWLYGVTHNYGIAIIVITVVIKLIFYPLTVKSFRSMQAMQQLQPQMKRLQDMYKNDRQKLNEEMMKLYREQKVNPLGGCLPMVVQIPVFIALYQVLYTSIELRHAGFIWWIKDLSAPDYPMALVMGASMVIQQWMTPTTGDPRQAKMMLFMPVIFTFMFLDFPVGLVIYWLVNNILTIAQQYVMLRMSRPATQAAAKA
jgi:YidC/Oxa1 family membrane protein insertase